jgi:hypothetical protein
MIFEEGLNGPSSSHTSQCTLPGGYLQQIASFKAVFNKRTHFLRGNDFRVGDIDGAVGIVELLRYS